MPVQGVLFDRRLWSPETAMAWLKQHHYYPIKGVETGPGFLHYRLEDPHQFRRIRTIQLGHGIELHIGWT